MFQRGSKIVITESSAAKRAHPAVGDIGYVSNMYLFYKHKFILLDAIFSDYKSNKASRCEHRKFIIDLGMTSKLRYKMTTTGADKRFFSAARHVTNLNMTGYYSAAGQIIEMPALYSNNGIWARVFTNKGQPISSKPVKIPVGNIAMVSTTTNRKDVLDSTTLRAWVRSMTPIINTHLYELLYEGDIVGQESIRNKIHKLYLQMSSYTTSIPLGNGGDRIQLKLGTCWPEARKLIDILRKIDSLSYMYIERIYERSIHGFKSNTGICTLVRNVWKASGWNSLWNIDITSGLSPHIPQIIMSAFFRSIFAPDDTYNKLRKVKPFIPISESSFDNLCDRFDKIRKEAICNSAALARIFEEKLLKQHKPLKR